MYIKQVIIEGFRSYKEQVATDTFSSKVNCVVGANGSGKSNFFHAIRFVISDLFQNLRNEDRHALLHEGAGHQLLSAFVEIVFDNSESRIPVDKEEVRLRRTIGLKKDEYFIDGKHITKTEAMNLLESAGFSRSNPYYVVQQGKIASLTLMKDNERLDLLKEIGGTRVYEERRRESLKIMQDTGNKRKQIIQVVQYLDERLRELDEEKEELKKYQQFDKQRKSLEYTIYDKGIHDARQKVAELENARKKVSGKSTKLYNQMLEAHIKSKELDSTFKELTKEIQSISKEKEALEKQRKSALKKHAQLELDTQDLEEKISGGDRAKVDAEKQLRNLQKEIQDSEKELNKARPEYNRKLGVEEKIKKRIMEYEKELSILYQKQGRATQFASKTDLDKWLQKEIDDYQRVLSANQLQKEKIQKEIQELEDDIAKQDKYVEQCNGKITDLESQISQFHEGFNRHKSERDILQDERKSLWGRESELSGEINRLKAEVGKAEKSLGHATPGDVRKGLLSVRGICNEHGFGGVFGPVIELLDCEENLFTAVEVTAGNSLFHVVVETDEVSTQIIRLLNARKGGRVTFIPLNRVMAPHMRYPQSSDVRPLIKELKYLPKYEPAFTQLFARTVICRDVDVATRVARSNGLDCVTMEGDQVSKKGGMTGGFYDSRRSKLKFMNVIRQNTKAIGMKEDELKQVRSALQDGRITELLTEQQKNDAKLAHEKSELGQLRCGIADSNKQKDSISISLAKKEKLLERVQNQVAQLQTNIAMKQDEMSKELVDHLTPEEKNKLSQLNPEITRLKHELLECLTVRVEIESRISEIENNLSTNLVRRKEELEAVRLPGETDMLRAEAYRKKQELSEAKSLVDDLTQKLNEVSAKINEHTRKLEELKVEKSEFEASEEGHEQALQDEAKELEQLLIKKSILLAKEENYSKKIKELGPLSSDAFDAYKRRSTKELHRMLQKCNEQLQQFSHVNKQALDQYVNFTEQREELQKRQVELDAGNEKIKDLISVLDLRKDESIERTFKGVAKHFHDVFAELVQGGKGFLVMTKKKDGDHIDDDQDEDASPATDMDRTVEKYIGVKVKVSFTGQGETQSMKQLSGGQKTVVALTLIFAIQRCDPAPFYLFDEIDAALDPQYRTAVGNMIRRLADEETSQFITTTFRPELVKVADKIYGVTHKNRVSRVNIVSKDEALEFIEQDQSHNADWLGI